MRRGQFHTTRADAIARVHAHLHASGYPRVVVLFIVALSGGVAFLASAGLLRLGLEQMGVRYPLATLAGYVTFLILIRVWLAYRRGMDDDHNLASEIANTIPSDSVPVRLPDRPDAVMFDGGRTGGGGGGEMWEQSTSGIGGTFDIPDADELWPIVLGALCAVGALFALVYVVWAAPLLLAEVALDAAVIGGLYRRLRREDARHWLDSAFRRTWLPATAISLTLMAVGFAAQWAVPTAQSIGDVVRELVPRS